METGFQLKKNWENYPSFFSRLFRKTMEKGMVIAQAFPVECEEVLDVESKWPYLPITPTYDQYVHRWVIMSESEGFHLKTRSDMEQLFEDVKWMVFADKTKKRILFKFRVDV